MELSEFLIELQTEIRAEVASSADSVDSNSAFPEAVFAERVTNHMSDIGMTFDPTICNYTAKDGSAVVRLNGYALSDELDELDLFVSLYSGSDHVETIPDSDTTKAALQCVRFLDACVRGKLSSKMDPSHEAFELVATIEATYEELDQIRIFVLTDRRAKTKTFQDRDVQGKTIKLQVVDIERLFNHLQEGRPRDELVISLEEIAGDALPCVWVPNPTGEYDYAMTAMPGETLRYLYDRYGQRILEANVRSFLQQTGKVNKGIRDTLRDQPERFMAYNNGIVLIVDDLTIGKTRAGGPGITWMSGLQIVNGGQTTASMYFTKKKYPDTDLSQVMVPAKVLVLRSIDGAAEEALVNDISRYANSQNAVRQSDLSANQPFHVELEKIANTVYCPDGVGRWFYERATGSYKVLIEREGKTPAGIKRLKTAIIPPSRKIIKTDLAKFECAWMQRPDLVSLGGQKAFQAYMALMTQQGDGTIPLPNITEFKNIVARALLFKAIYKTIRREYPAYQANITAYTVAITSRLIGKHLHLDYIWKHQGVSRELHDQMYIWSQEISDYLHQTSRGRMISEWAKKQECWEVVSGKTYVPSSDNIPELENL